jgi:hypothetical protein
MKVTALFVVVAFLVAGCASRDDPSSTVATGASLSLGLSDRTLASFRAFGTVFHDADAVPSVTAEQALQASRGAYGLATDTPDEIALGTLTVPTYGQEVSDDPSISVVDPFIKDRLVWVVVYDDVLQPGSGPAPSTDDPAAPREMRAGLWVAVDASSGEVLQPSPSVTAPAESQGLDYSPSGNATR